MVRLPNYDSNRQLDTGTEFFRPRSDEGLGAAARGYNAKSDAALQSGKAQGDLWGAVSNFAQAIVDKNAKLATFAAQKELLDLEDRTDAGIIDAQKNISESGANFYSSNIDGVTKDTQATLDRLPGFLRPEFEVKAKDFLNRRADQLRTIEFNQGKQYVSRISERTMERLKNNVANGVWGMEEATHELDSFLANSSLPTGTGEFLKREGTRNIELSRIERLRTVNPEGFLKETLKYMPNAPSRAAGDLQKLAIETATSHGVDPLLPLTVGTLESNWNPDAKASKTIFGVYQLSKDLRQELGIPENMKTDPAFQTEGMIRLIKKYEANLAANNIPATPSTVWASHFLGRAGVVAFYNAKFDANAYEVYKGVAGARIADQAFDGSNGDLLKKGMTVGEVRDAIAKKTDAAVKQAQTYIQKTPVKTNGPVEIAGEKFSSITQGDLGTAFGGAVAASGKAADDRFEQMNKTAVDIGALNGYNEQGRELINKEVSKTDLPTRFASGDAAAFVQSQELLKTYNYLPAPIAQQAMNMIAGTDPQSKAIGYDMLAQAHATDQIRGLENSSVVGDMRNRVETYTALKTVYKLSPSVAVAQTDRLFSAEYKDKLTKIDATKLADEMKLLNWKQVEKSLNLDQTWLFGLVGTDATPNAPAKQAIMQRYRDRFEFWYKYNQDRKAAQALAIQDITNAHGKSRVTAREQLVLYPPENYYPKGPDGTHAYITEQLNEYVQSYVSTQAERAKKPELKNIDLKKVTIAGTADTGLDLQAGREPRYEVFYEDANGDLQMIPTPFAASPERASGRMDLGKSGQAKTAPTTTAQQTPADNVDIGALRNKRAKEKKDNTPPARRGTGRTS